MAVTVRPARSDDREVVKRLLGEFIEYLNAIEPSDAAVDLDILLDQSFGPDPVCRTLIAEAGGRPVGYISFHPGVWEIWRSIYVISLFVGAEARGTGAGRALMDAVKEIARAQQAQRIVWEVWRKNPLAIGFYQGIGGEVFDENLRMSLVVE
ncbi:GNAT family N-acetyltransferase [Dongia sp.]|uniref:GNAT family N-acetyltransferase n=1 Tax=Dongia sp. TaxID=1977262 RepID=UPI003750C346